MKILFTSDWQCCVSNLDRCEQTLSQILDVCDEQKVDAVVNLGDVKDAFNPVDQRVTNFLVHSTEQISQRCQGKYLVLLGNHDRTTTSDDSHSCLPVLEAAGAMTFENPGAFYFGDGVYIRMVPYMRDKERLKKAFSDDFPERHVKDLKTMLLGFHAEVNSCRLNVQVTGKSDLSLAEMQADAYDFVLGGHIHYHQQIGRNAYYVGSPFCQDWGEANQTKGLVLLVIGKNGSVQIRGIESRIRGWYDPDLPGFPHYIKDWKDTRVRIRVPITSDPAKTISEARSSAEAKYVGARIHLVPVYEERNKEVILKDGDSDHKLIQKFLEQTSLSVEDSLAYLKRRIPSIGHSSSGITLRKAYGTEVLCYKKVSLDLESQGLVLITGKNKDWKGSNGSGKTSLLSILVIALSGYTLKGQSHNDWVREKYTGKPLAGLIARMMTGEDIEIVRTRDPNRLDFLVNGKNLSMGDIRETQKIIESYTGLNWEVLTNSLYVGQREVATILTGTDKQRKELFSKFLNLDRFEKAHKLIKSDVSDTKTFLEYLETGSSICDSFLEEQTNFANQYKSSIQKIDESLGETLKGKLNSLVKEIAVYESKEKALQEFLVDNQDRYDQYLDKSIRIESKLENLQAWLERAGSISGTCPLCGSKTSVESLESHAKHLETEMKKLEEQLKVVERFKEINRSKRQKRLELKRLNESKKQEVIKERFKVQTALEVWKEKLESNKKQLNVLETINKKIAKANKTRTWFKQAASIYTEHLEFLEGCLEAVSRDGLPAYISSSVCPALNSAAEKYSDLFSDGKIKVRFEMVFNDLDVQIINEHGGDSIRDQSEGELRMAGLIAIFAFREVLVQCNVLVLDEPGEGLDAENAQTFARALRNIADKFGSVFVTSHNSNILGYLEPDKHIEVTKENGVSEVKYL